MGLPGRLLAILLLVATIDFVANSIVLDRANDFALREDDAARMAEHLTIAYRVIERTQPANRSLVARELSTERFSIRWSAQPDALPTTVSLTRLRAQVLAFEPDLGKVDLRMHLLPLRGRGDIGGSMTLSDRSYLTFRTFSRSAWTLNLGRVGQTVLPTALLALLAWFLFRTTLRPLATLVQATRRVGSAQPQSLPETGPAEVRELIHAFNAMQLRIHELLARGSQTLLAIGHDLRTPLARLRLETEMSVPDPEAREHMVADISQVDSIINKFLDYARPDHVNLQALPLAELVAASVMPFTAREDMQVKIDVPPDLHVMGDEIELSRTLSNLLENARRYGQTPGTSVTQVHIAAAGRDHWVILRLRDRGPGVRPEVLPNLTRPFFRGDTARTSATGAGLGLSIVAKMVGHMGGSLVLSNSSTGGLVATIRLQQATDHRQTSALKKKR